MKPPRQNRYRTHWAGQLRGDDVGQLRSSGLRAQMEQAGRSLKGQLKQADRLGARWTVILGDEIEVKDMDTGAQQRADSVDEVLGMVGA